MDALQREERYANAQRQLVHAGERPPRKKKYSNDAMLFEIEMAGRFEQYLGEGEDNEDEDDDAWG
jgi:hypothetical protein